MGLVSLLLTFGLCCGRVAVVVAEDCDKSNPPSNNPYYKYFCGQTFVVGFSDQFEPYSWKVGEAQEPDETLKYLTSVSDYATIDGWVGLDPDIMDEVANFLGFNYTVVDVEIPGAGDTWTSILEKYMDKIDIMGNNFALSPEREHIGFFSERQVDMSAFIVQLSTYESNSYKWQDAFRFLAPFSRGVWIALGICMVLSAFVVYLLDWSFYVERRVEKTSPAKSQQENDKHLPEDIKKFPMNFETDMEAKNVKGNKTGAQDVRQNTEDESDEEADDSTTPITLFDSFYFAFASFTGAEQFAPVSKPSKIFVASWSVLVLIVLSTYTANLAATLTKNNGFVEEIQTVEDAIRLGAKTCVSTRNVYYPSLPQNYSNTDELSQLSPYLPVNGLWTDLYEYLQNGTCRIAIFNREDITAALQNQDYCDLIVVGGMSDSDGNGYADSEQLYFSTGLVMNFHDNRTQIYNGVNAALQHLQSNGRAQYLRNSWAGGVCTLDSEVVEDDVTSIQVKHLMGPFGMHFAVGCCIIIYAIIRHIVIYYSIDLKYFKRDLAVHAETFEDDIEHDDDSFDEGDVRDESLLTRQALYELNNRIMSLENEIKISNSRIPDSKENAGEDARRKLTESTHHKGDSFNSTFSVHEFHPTDLDTPKKQKGDQRNKSGFIGQRSLSQPHSTKSANKSGRRFHKSGMLQGASSTKRVRYVHSKHIMR